MLELDRILEVVREPFGLLCDFDGTLSEIVRRPGDARIRPRARDAIAKLVARGSNVAIVSGRDVADLRARVDVAGLWLVGCHGAQLETPHGLSALLVDDARARPAIEAFIETARACNVEVEDKGVAAAAHTRPIEDPSVLSRVTSRLEECAARLSRDGTVSWISGKRVVEVRVPGASKGLAARELLARWPAGSLPVAIGDDTTDEDMFVVANGRSGVAIKVGAGTTVANARVADPAAVELLLEKLAER